MRDQSVIFESGRTVMEVAKAIVTQKIGLLAITNDIQIAQPIRVWR